jgi:DNA mismatch repair protein MutL
MSGDLSEQGTRASRIRILDEEVANKIAAGEVVERPASVVKELVENAVDAGATRVVVDLEDGGRRLIRVADNGSGMTAQEAVLALQRHATSKITRAEDLSAVRTLGFRGEALPSIASVSRLTLVTRAVGELSGTKLFVEGGEIRSLEEVGAPEGTTFTVADLFYNTPARLKFLKSPRTELGQACDWLIRIALAQTEIAVKLTHDGVEALQSPGSPERVNAIAALYGREVARELLAVAWERGGLRIEGYVSRPTFTRPTRSGQSFFVNGRFVRSRTLTHALDEAYRATMHAGRFPFAVLAIDVDPSVVDVNVHPTKAEVRFLREWELHRAVHEAVRSALGPSAEAGPDAPLAAEALVSQSHLQRAPWTASGAGGATALGPRGAGSLFGPRPPLGPPPMEDDPFADPPPAAEAGGGQAAAVAQPPIPDPATGESLAPAAALRPVAQLWSSYILAEGPTGLVIVDQHLAHERVLFDRLVAAGKAAFSVAGSSEAEAVSHHGDTETRRTAHGEGTEEEKPSEPGERDASGSACPGVVPPKQGTVAQRLAMPVTITLAHRQALLVDEHLPALMALGFEVEPFGRDAFVVRAVPAFVRPGAEGVLLHEILDELSDSGGPGRLPALQERVAATTACKAAIKKGERLAREEIQRLLDDLARTSQPHTCPHGCPIAVEISYQELLKRFKRI